MSALEQIKSGNQNMKKYCPRTRKQRQQ